MLRLDFCYTEIELPYSRNFEGENFRKFRVLVAICESFLCEIWGWDSIWRHQQTFHESFLHENDIFHQLTKVLSLDVLYSIYSQLQRGIRSLALSSPVPTHPFNTPRGKGGLVTTCLYLHRILAVQSDWLIWYWASLPHHLALPSIPLLTYLFQFTEAQHLTLEMLSF